MKTNVTKHRLRISGLVALALGFTWLNGGVNFLAFKVGVSALPAIFLAALRFTVAGLVLLPVAAWRSHNRNVLTFRQFAAAGLMGVIMLIGGQTGTIWGVHYLPAGVASVFGSAPPLFLALFAWLLLHQPLGKWQLVGVSIGFAGIALMGWSSATAVSFQPIGAISVLAAGAAWAGGSLLQSRVQTPEDPIINLTVQLLVAGLLLWLLVWMTGTADQVNFAELPRQAWIAIAFLTFVSTLIGYGVFTWLNIKVSSTLANTYNYVSPAITLGLAALFLNEPLTWTKAASAGVVLVGVALMVSHSDSHRN
ncbi:MAG: EamA family transporter [Nostoc sp.]|uniref:DMT family transporter n=1 Tax=Nostoc sp. TaxID=1180 RepID=UPI002FF8FC92